MRRIVSVIGISLVAVVCAAAPAAATVAVAPVAGNISCALTGTMSFSKPLPNANSDTGALHNTHVKINAKMSDCNSTGVTGGKAPITGGTMSVTGILEPGASCSDIQGGSPPDFTFDTNKFSAKWTSTVATRHPVVAQSKSDVFTTGNTLFGGWEYVTDNDPTLATGAFAGEAAMLDLYIDNTLAVDACALGEVDANGKPITLSSVSFSAARGSRIVIPSPV